MSMHISMEDKVDLSKDSNLVDFVVITVEIAKERKEEREIRHHLVL